jgi:hypothetical protein
MLNDMAAVIDEKIRERATVFFGKVDCTTIDSVKHKKYLFQSSGSIPKSSLGRRHARGQYEWQRAHLLRMFYKVFTFPQEFIWRYIIKQSADLRNSTEWYDIQIAEYIQQTVMRKWIKCSEHVNSIQIIEKTSLALAPSFLGPNGISGYRCWRFPPFPTVQKIFHSKKIFFNTMFL